MDLAHVKIRKQDIEVILAEARPGRPASFTGDACTVYTKARPFLVTAVAILNAVYPPAASAVAALMAIMDQACK
jgi:hypothetical protein